jgi:hypothetical protein
VISKTSFPLNIQKYEQITSHKYSLPPTKQYIQKPPAPETKNGNQLVAIFHLVTLRLPFTLLDGICRNQTKRERHGDRRGTTETY